MRNAQLYILEVEKERLQGTAALKLQALWRGHRGRWQHYQQQQQERERLRLLELQISTHIVPSKQLPWETYIRELDDNFSIRQELLYSRSTCKRRLYLTPAVLTTVSPPSQVATLQPQPPQTSDTFQRYTSSPANKSRSLFTHHQLEGMSKAYSCTLGSTSTSSRR